MKCEKQGERQEPDVEIYDEEGSIVVVCHNLYCEQCEDCTGCGEQGSKEQATS